MPPPLVTGDVGTAGPVRVHVAATDGSWVALCQKEALRLVNGPGAGEPIDELVALSRDGRWLAAVRGGKLALLDAQARTWTELTGADVRDDLSGMWPHRAASIASDGTSMTYFRGADRVVVRELPGGKEREVAVRGVWRAQVTDDGRWAEVWSHSTLPPLRSSPDNVCKGDVELVLPYRGGIPKIVWLELASGRIVDEGDRVVGAVGADLLRTTKAGALELGGKELAPASCRAEVLAVTASPARVIYRCTKARGAPVVFATRDRSDTTTVTDGESLAENADGVVCFGLTCLDLATNRTLVPAPTPSWDDPAELQSAIRTYRTMRLVDDGGLAVVDLRDRSRVAVGERGGGRGGTFQSGPIVLVGDAVIDLAFRRRLGTAKGRAHAVDTFGHVLVGPEDGSGPLRWVTPVPSPGE